MDEADKKKDRFASLSWDVHRLKELIVCYKILFDDESDLNALIKFESEFFSAFQILITESIVGRVSKLVDKRRDVVSLHQFLETYIDKNTDQCLFQKFREVNIRANNIVRLRHNWIAHKNHNVAIGLRRLPEVKVSDLEQVIEMFDNFLIKLEETVYPNGVIGSNGEKVFFVQNERAKAYTGNLVEKIKRANGMK